MFENKQYIFLPACFFGKMFFPVGSVRLPMVEDLLGAALIHDRHNRYIPLWKPFHPGSDR
jgi:hypothetical protein